MSYTCVMSWAGNRRLLIVAVALFAALVVVASVLIATLPKEPSCSDGLQNQNESGVDCGGSCAYLCSAEVVPPSVSYIRALTASGRTDVVALVENLDPSASVRDARYAVELFAADGTLLASRDGVMDLAPGESVPVFMTGLLPAGAPVARAFLSFDEASMNWRAASGERTLPRAEAVRVEGTPDSPRVAANLRNPSATALADVRVVVAVRDIAGTVIAASQTVVEALPGQSSVPVTFTWNEPFLGAPGAIDIQAIVPLP